MSRIGIRPITIPAGVEVTIDGNVITVKGPNGTLTQPIDADLSVEVNEGVVTVSRPNDSRKNRSQHGLARTLINNMIVGVTTGYQKSLKLIGVGYAASKQGNKLVMKLGYSHPIEMEDPEGITTEVPDATTVLVKGANKAQVGNYASNIRAWRKPEPYKGKGIFCDNETVIRKEGKSGSK